jgi:hypothetical protein
LELGGQGMKLSATILDQTDALGQFEIQPVWAFGHSWQASTGNATVGARWWERVSKRLNMGTEVVKAVSGRTIGDNTMLALAGANSWTPRTKALVVAGCTINDLVRFGGSAEGRRAYIHAWRAMLSILTCNAAVAGNTPAFVYSAGWTRASVVGTAADTSGLVKNSTGGQQWTTTTPGSYFEFNFTGTSADVFLVAKMAGAGLVTFKEGATTLGTLDLTAAVAQDTPAIFKIRGLSSGTHLIRGTLTSGASLTVDSYRIPLSAAAPILVFGEPPLIWDTYGADATYEALMTSFKGELATICAEFPTVKYLDLNQPGWDQSIMLTSDGIHPNDAGCAWIASKAIQKLREFPYLLGLNKLAASYPADYVAPANPSVPGGGAVGGATTIAADTFNRTDAAVLGSTDTGAKPWSIILGPSATAATASINANRALISSRTATSGWVMAAFDGGATDFIYRGQVGSPVSGRNALLFSIVDGSNFLYLYPNGAGSVILGKRLADVGTTIQDIAATVNSNSVMQVTVSGTTVTVHIDDVQVYTGTVADKPNGTKVGFGQSTSTFYDAYFNAVTLTTVG